MKNEKTEKLLNTVTLAKRQKLLNTVTFEIKSEFYKPPEPENSNIRSKLNTVLSLFNKYVGEGIRGFSSHRDRSRNRSFSNSEPQAEDLNVTPPERVQKSKLSSQTTSKE